jgi:solute carrier family 40 (iron-regulated transporter), member 1
VLGANWVGNIVDSKDRLIVVKTAMIIQRACIAMSCGLCAIMTAFSEENYLKGTRDIKRAKGRDLIIAALFVGLLVLAGFEKLAFMAVNISVERDWVIVISTELQRTRSELNAFMKGIDLFTKIVTPVATSAIQTWSTFVAIIFVGGWALLSMAPEWYFLAKIYNCVSGLKSKNRIRTSTASLPTAESLRGSNTPGVWITWKAYFKSPVMLPSVCLSLLYLTVLSTGVQWQTYMLSIGYPPLTVALLRLVGVVFEFTATKLSPWLINRITAIRAASWFLNWQAAWLAMGVTAFWVFGHTLPMISSIVLTVGIIFSRLGLFGFDLAVQDMVQEVYLPILLS